MKIIEVENSLEKCPKCGSENIDYYCNKIFDGSMLGYEFKCQEENCGIEGTEWYNVEYSCSSYKEKENE